MDALLIYLARPQRFSNYNIVTKFKCNRAYVAAGGSRDAKFKFSGAFAPGADFRGDKGALPPIASIRQNCPTNISGLGRARFWVETSKIRRCRCHFRKFWANFRKKWPKNAIKLNFGQKFWILKSFA